jgi:hypothetical protein
MDTQTGHQAALFDAPRDPGQGTLFGGTYLAADELAELGDQAAAAAGPLVIVGCGAGKLRHAAPAGELYTGQQFRACMATARAITTPDRIRILSAAHGLLTLDQETAPDDVKMGDVGSITPHTLRQQAARAGLFDGGPVVLLAGASYTFVVRAVWPEVQTPLAGLAIGKQRQRLAELRAGLDKLSLGELAERRHVARVARQREIYLARADEARDHRRFCVRCVDGKRCRDGRKLDAEQRVAGDAYGAMMRGEIQ